MFARTTMTAAIGVLMLIASPAQAQELSPELKALDAQLPGDLINDPTSLEWERYGGGYKAEGKVDPSIPGGGAALHYEIPRKGTNPYDIGANVPLLSGITKGDTVTVGFYARTLSADTPDGKAVIGVRFGSKVAPYPGFGEQVVSPGREWDWYEVSAPANMAISRRDAVVGLQFAGAKQSFEIGQTIVVKGAPSIVGKPVAAPAPVAAELPAPLQGIGTLLNDPANRNWGSNGPAGSAEPRDDGTIWLGKATRFTSASVGANPWDVGTSIPAGTSIAVGDRLIVAIAAKTQSAATTDGKAVVGIRIQSNQPPYSGFGDKSFALGPSWQLIRVPFTVTEAMTADQASISLHFAGAQQAVDIGPVYLFKAK